jgi:hypothetical protein
MGLGGLDMSLQDIIELFEDTTEFDIANARTLTCGHYDNKNEVLEEYKDVKTEIVRTSDTDNKNCVYIEIVKL